MQMQFIILPLTWAKPNQIENPNTKNVFLSNFKEEKEEEMMM